MNVLVTDNIDPECDRVLKAAGFSVTRADAASPEKLAELVPGAEVLLVRSTTKIEAPLLSEARRLQLIGRAGEGIDNIDVDAATRLGIIVMNAPGANTSSVAEHACGMLLAAARRITAADASLRAGNWEKKNFCGTELRGKTLGIIGFGKIGREVSRRMQSFGMSIMAFDPMVPEEYAARFRIRLTGLDELLQRSDAVTIHASLNDATRNLIDRDRFRKMKDGVLLVNCARGGIVNEADLAEALTGGKVGMAALDVFRDEPPAPESPLLDSPNVILTPHIAGSTKEALKRAAVQIAEQIVDWKRNGRYNGAVNASAIELASDPAIRPWLELAEKLGAMTALENNRKEERVSIAVSGEFLRKFTPVLEPALLKGLLGASEKTKINYISASAIAEEQGITVETGSTGEHPDYSNLLCISSGPPEEERTICGTVFEETPRIVMIDDYRLEFRPEGCVLLYRNQDRPGVLAGVAELLLRKNINVAALSLSRRERNQTAMTAIALDGMADENLAREVSALDGVLSAILFRL
ncbi:phosphoglycerate dehydrogenase [Prosthecochloris sp. GSB1]|uniref:phosphoglycerate dehydrogenase n=1 Tax=Prosthecochloris sp. GSB1 TaxID=281093 RepID=UPI000B8C7514|nr:phosphoglycerate dehydrogenase [Prosthecochloris sp. GSB1]ASQ90316.1 phosphoglycerate dehydrogenase [Prosthecochloris sp. GSB1]